MKTIKISPILDTDSYKASHYLQYPPKTERVYSYIESRPGGLFERTVFFGLQYILNEYFSDPVTVQDVEYARDFFEAHGEPFPFDAWMTIVKEHKGKLPLKIRAVDEGMVVPVGNILMSVENTDYRFPWLTNWFETKLLRIWYPTTVATISWYAKKIILDSLFKTADAPWAEIMFKLHDFGSRGVSSLETAALGGAAHLVNFQGSDTVVGVLLANKIYHSGMSAYSIPAMEHSTVTSWGREREIDSYDNMLTQFAKPGAILAAVSDSYDLWNAIDRLWGVELKDKVIKSGATIVIRPDSGNPPEVVVKALKLLDSRFGSVPNSKGYKVLNNVRVIQGDGINDVWAIRQILDATENAGFSTTNISFGMGAGLLQKVNRDTQRFAMKASEVLIDGKAIAISKSPITDLSKASKQGRMDLIRTGACNYKTVYGPENWDSAMRTYFHDGKILVDDSLSQIRSRAKEHLLELFK